MDAIHFYSFPFTSERSKEKVVDLAKILSKFKGNMKLYVINFTEIQKIIGIIIIFPAFYLIFKKKI